MEPVSGPTDRSRRPDPALDRIVATQRRGFAPERVPQCSAFVIRELPVGSNRHKNGIGSVSRDGRLSGGSPDRNGAPSSAAAPVGVISVAKSGSTRKSSRNPVTERSVEPQRQMWTFVKYADKMDERPVFCILDRLWGEPGRHQAEVPIAISPLYRIRWPSEADRAIRTGHTVCF